MLTDTSTRRETARMDAPSHGVERTWTRLAVGSSFMPGMT